MIREYTPSVLDIPNASGFESLSNKELRHISWTKNLRSRVFIMKHTDA